MPKTALADTLVEWDSLLTALDQPEILAQPHIQELRAELSAVLQSVRALAMEQSALQARRQVVTQQLRINRSKGHDLVIKVRSAVRSLSATGTKGSSATASALSAAARAPCGKGPESSPPEARNLPAAPARIPSPRPPSPMRTVFPPTKPDPLPNGGQPMPQRGQPLPS